MNNKLKAWFFEDKKDLAETFHREMTQYFDILVFEEFSELNDALKTGRPDVILLALHDPETDSIDHEQAHSTVDKLNQAIDIIENCIPVALEEEGLRYLDSLREKYSPQDLPILIYTRVGQYTLDEHELQNRLDQDSHFFLKRFNPELKLILMEKDVKKWRLSTDVFIQQFPVKVRHTCSHRKLSHIYFYCATTVLSKGHCQSKIRNTPGVH